MAWLTLDRPEVANAQDTALLPSTAWSTPHLVWVRISADGHDGPYTSRPGLDRTGII